MIWDIYARCYDVIARLTPYGKMVAEVMGAVPEDPRRVLDAGCGTGNLSRALADKSPGEVVAADLSAVMLKRSRRKNAHVKHVFADLDGDLHEVSGEFDVIVCGNVLYTLKDPARSMETLRSRLKPGGRLVVTTPRAGAGTKPILHEHIKDRGVGSLAKFVVPLMVVGVINVWLLRNAHHHFLTRDELRKVLLTDDIRTTYSGQVWLAVHIAD